MVEFIRNLIVTNLNKRFGWEMCSPSDVILSGDIPTKLSISQLSFNHWFFGITPSGEFKEFKPSDHRVEYTGGGYSNFNNLANLYSLVIVMTSGYGGCERRITVFKCNTTEAIKNDIQRWANWLNE